VSDSQRRERKSAAGYSKSEGDQKSGRLRGNRDLNHAKVSSFSMSDDESIEIAAQNIRSARNQWQSGQFYNAIVLAHAEISRQLLIAF
jgi:hypothetical protein